MKRNRENYSEIFMEKQILFRIRRWLLLLNCFILAVLEGRRVLEDKFIIEGGICLKGDVRISGF